MSDRETGDRETLLGLPRRRAREARRTWIVAAGLVLLVVLAASVHVRHESQCCDLCASYRHTSQVGSWFGITLWSDESAVSPSPLLTDGLAGADHRHAWSSYTTHESTLFVGASIGRGRPRYGGFVARYDGSKELRRAVLDGIADGTITHAQIEHELELPTLFLAAPHDPVLADLVRKYEPSVERAR